jgi:hypothetical protein
MTFSRNPRAAPHPIDPPNEGQQQSRGLPDEVKRLLMEWLHSNDRFSVHAAKDHLRKNLSAQAYADVSERQIEDFLYNHSKRGISTRGDDPLEVGKLKQMKSSPKKARTIPASNISPAVASPATVLEPLETPVIGLWYV